MATEGLPAERLRAYLSDLKPQARAKLMAEIERSAQHGAAIPGAALILEQLRPVLRERTERPDRVISPARLFFGPLEPFLIDNDAARIPPGRIPRSSLDAHWGWISNSLLPGEAAAFSAEVTGGARSASDPAIVAAARAFQGQAAREIASALDLASADERFHRRLAAMIRTPHALEEARTLQVVLTHQEMLSGIAGRLPGSIRNFGDDQVDNILAILKPIAEAPPPARQQALILVADRLGQFWQLIRLAIRSAENDTTAKVAQSPFSPAVDMVLADIRARAEELRGYCRLGRFTDALQPAKDIHDAIRAVRTELDLSPDSAWGRELAAIRSAISDLLKYELEATSGLVRRLLRPRSVREGQAAGTIDASEVEEVEARIGFAAACRHYAGELAINQIAPRVHSELQSYFDTSVSTLIESLRTAEGADRRFRQSQVDAAIRFAGKLFGAEFASLLAKAAAIAGQERKPARA